MLGSPDDPRWDDNDWISELALSVNPPVCYYYWNGEGEVPSQYRKKANKITQTNIPFQCAKSNNPSMEAQRRKRFEDEKRELALMDEAQKNEKYKDKKINT